MSLSTRYLTCITKPLLFVVLALLLALFPRSVTLFTASVVVASVLGTLDLYRMLTRANAIRFSFTLAVSILLGYGLGSGIYLANYQTVDATQFQYWARYGVFFSQYGLSMALSASLMAAGALYFRSIFEPPIYVGRILDAFDDPRSLRVFWLGLAIVVLALNTGGIGYMGAFVDDSGRVSPLGALATLVAPVLVPYAVLVITGENSFAKRAILIAILVFLLAVLFALGRRYLLYSLVLSVLAFNMRAHDFTARRLVVVMLLSAAGVLVLYWGFKIFMALRFAVWTHGEDVALSQLVRAAMSQLSGEQAALLDDALAENVGSRTFILSYLAVLIEVNSINMPALGGRLFHSVQMSMPSLFIPGKLENLPAVLEEFIHPRYGIPVFDGPNSVLVAGFDDFGFFGAMIYPLFVVFLFGLFYKSLCIISRDEGVRLFVLFVLLFQLLFIEQALSTVFVTLRNLIIVIGLAWVIGRFPRMRFVDRARDRNVSRDNKADDLPVA